MANIRRNGNGYILFFFCASFLSWRKPPPNTPDIHFPCVWLYHTYSNIPDERWANCEFVFAQNQVFCSVQITFGVKQLTCFDLFSQKHWVSVPDPRWCHSPVLTRKWTPQSIAWSSSPSWHTHTQTHTRAHNAYIELEVKKGPNLRLNWNNENQNLRFSNVLVFRLGSCFILF